MRRRVLDPTTLQGRQSRGKFLLAFEDEVGDALADDH